MSIFCLPNGPEVTHADLFDEFKVADRPCRAAIRVRGFITANEAEATPTRRARDLLERRILDDLNWVVAVWAADVHGVLLDAHHFGTVDADRKHWTISNSSNHKYRALPPDGAELPPALYPIPSRSSHPTCPTRR